MICICVKCGEAKMIRYIVPNILTSSFVIAVNGVYIYQQLVIIMVPHLRCTQVNLHFVAEYPKHVTVHCMRCTATIETNYFR